MPPVQSFNTQDGASVTHSDDQHEPIDPLTIGELITMQEAEEYCGLSRLSLQKYIHNGRLRGVKRGWMWFTTRAAVDAYLQSRHMENIPKKYRKPT